MEYYKLTVLLFPVLFAYLLHDNWSELSSLLKYKLSPAGDVDLVVGILSARDHWEERMAIRETWMANVTHNKSISQRISVKFIVGSQACHIAPAYRQDEKSCEKLTRHLPDIDDLALVKEEQLFSPEHTPKSYVRNYAVQRISFRVLHPVIMTQLGIHSSSLTGKVAVKLLDAHLKKEIVSAVFEQKKEVGQTGFIYQTVQAYMLPKGFEGILVGENLQSSKTELPVSYNALNLTIDASYGFIEVLQPSIPEISHYNDPRELVFTRLPVVSFLYSIHEKDDLLSDVTSYEERNEAWKKVVAKEDEKLQEEQETHGDLLFVDIVDVYKNIPSKVIEFHKWAAETYEFKWLLKTDDDCYVDIEKIYNTLTSSSSLLPQQKLWWGRFRHNWAVDLYGKWAEFMYPSPSYPSFACGAGNVLSRDLVTWIAGNSDMLHHYQGEDTSLGIWLAAVSPHYIDDPLWQCDSECMSDMYAMPQLHPSTLKQHWNNRQQCGDPCGCS